MEEAQKMIDAWADFKRSTKKFVKASREFARISGLNLETAEFEHNLKRPEPECDTNNVEEEFECSGQMWLDPPEPCIGGELSRQKESINFQGPEDKKRRRYTVCKGCKNARNRWNNKRRREEKKSKEQD